MGDETLYKVVLHPEGLHPYSRPADRGLSRKQADRKKSEWESIGLRAEVLPEEEYTDD